MYHSKKLNTYLLIVLLITGFATAVQSQGNIKLDIEGNVLLNKIGPEPGRLILKTQSAGDPGRYGILFSNNLLAPFLGEDTGDQQYDFYSVWGKTRMYDASISIHGKAADSWGTVLKLTHNGDDGRISTDVGNLILDPDDGSGYVGIGTDDPLSKLHVEGKGIFFGTNEALFTSVSSRNNITNSAMGIRSTADFDDNQALKHGFNTTIRGDGQIHYGVHSVASEASINYGVWANAQGSSSTSCYGVFGKAEGSATNKYGIYGNATGNGGTKYGVYGTASGTGTNYAGYFNGDVFATGSYLPSDIRLKTDIVNAPSSLNRLNDLQVSTYQYKENSSAFSQLPEGIQTGLLAQQVAILFPELVKEIGPTENNGIGTITTASNQQNLLGVNYLGLIPHLVKSIQEQQNQLEELTKRQEKLEKINRDLLARLKHFESQNK